MVPYTAMTGKELFFFFKSPYMGISLVVQWIKLHTSNAGGWVSNPDQGTRSQRPQLRIHVPQLNLVQPNK